MVSEILVYLKNQFKMGCCLLENNWTSVLKGCWCYWILAMSLHCVA